MLMMLMGMVDTPEQKNKLERLYLKYKNKMLNAALQIVKDHALAEDAVHDAFVKVIGILDKVDEEKAGGLMITIARNRAIDLIRQKNYNHIPLDEIQDIPDDAPLPIDTMVSDAGYKQLVDYIGELDEIYKSVCRLKFIFRYDNENISKLLGITSSAVRSRLHNARKMLREKLVKEGGAE